MLFITRKKGQKIIIDKNVELEVIGVGQNNVKLGFNFPRPHSVYREELIEKAKENGTVDELQGEFVF